MNLYREHLRRRLLECQVPVTLHSGLIEYFAARQKPGQFLSACLENNLRDAITRADEQNRYYTTEIVLFLHSYVPSNAWGSPEVVAAWLASSAPVPEIFE